MSPRPKLSEAMAMDVIAKIEAGEIAVAAAASPDVPLFNPFVEAFASNGWAFYLVEDDADGGWLIDSLQTPEGAELSDEAIRGDGPEPPMPLLAGYRIDTPAKRLAWSIIPTNAPGGSA